MSRFDQKAHEWDKSTRRQALANAVAQCIQKTLESSAPKKILDFGCGTGLISYNLKDLASKIVGVDSSEKMRDVFNSKSDSPSIYAIDSIPNETFDLILSSMTMHHIKDIAPLAREFYKHLKNGGLLFIADLYKEDGSFHDDGNEGIYHFGFDPKELITLFEDAGFVFMQEHEVFKITKQKEYPIFCLVFQKRA